MCRIAGTTQRVTSAVDVGLVTMATLKLVLQTTVSRARARSPPHLTSQILTYLFMSYRAAEINDDG